MSQTTPINTQPILLNSTKSKKPKKEIILLNPTKSEKPKKENISLIPTYIPGKPLELYHSNHFNILKSYEESGIQIFEKCGIITTSFLRLPFKVIKPLKIKSFNK